jgi:hypothetical protein
MLEVTITANGKSETFPLEINEYAYMYFDRAEDAICDMLDCSIAAEIISYWIYEGGSVEGFEEGTTDPTDPSCFPIPFSYKVSLYGKPCTKEEIYDFAHLFAINI